MSFYSNELHYFELAFPHAVINVNISGDPLRKTIFGRRDLLQRISRSLDKEYKYGSCKCWKDAAEYFHVEEEEYQNFKCSQVHSPTEVMFEYLGTRKPEITIGDLKDGLRKIGRQDVIEVILNCGQGKGKDGSM